LEMDGGIPVVKGETRILGTSGLVIAIGRGKRRRGIDWCIVCVIKELSCQEFHPFTDCCVPVTSDRYIPCLYSSLESLQLILQ